MFVNNCGSQSHGECALRLLGRFSFQPLSENPFLGPSASTLDEMGALKQSLFSDYHQTWRLFTSPLLQAGLIHLAVNLGSVFYVGIHLEQEIGPGRIGLICILQALCGSLTDALCVRNRPTVGSLGAVFWLLGAMLAALVLDWKLYTHKFFTVSILVLIVTINLLLGLLPPHFINNLANIGGFIAGLLLGFVLISSPIDNEVPEGVATDHEVAERIATDNEVPERRATDHEVPERRVTLYALLQTRDPVKTLRSLDVLEGRLRSAIVKNEEACQARDNARRDGLSKKSLKKKEEASKSALKIENAQSEIAPSRAIISEHLVVDSVDDVDRVAAYFPAVQRVYSSSKLKNLRQHRDEYRQVLERAGRLGLSVDKV